MRLNLKADTEYFECKKIIIEQKQVRFSRIKGSKAWMMEVLQNGKVQQN